MFNPLAGKTIKVFIEIGVVKKFAFLPIKEEPIFYCRNVLTLSKMFFFGTKYCLFLTKI